MPDPIVWAVSGPYYLAALVAGYLLGSIPFGIVLTRLSGGPDLRTIGSGNIGATNVLRTGNKALAALTLLGDMLKGTVAVLLGGVFGPYTAIAAGVGAFLGHLFPLWLRFRGGKGVATFLGVLIALWWPGAILFVVTWLLVAAATRYSSLAALLGSLAVIIVGWGVRGLASPDIGRLIPWRPEFAEMQALTLLVLLLWIMHRANIGRLLAGRESRIGQKSPTVGP